MSTANVAAMINDLVVRYGLDDATGRADCLQWLQKAEEEAWARDGWWFKEQRVDVAVSGGTTEYTLTEFTDRLHAVELGDGGALTKLDPMDFREFIGSDATADATAQVWCPLEPNSSGYQRFKIWPVPSGSATLKAVYNAGPRTLTDSTSSKSAFPADWRHVVLNRAEVYAALHMGQQGQAQGFLQAYEEQIAALMAVNATQRRRGMEN